MTVVQIPKSEKSMSFGMGLVLLGGEWHQQAQTYHKVQFHVYYESGIIKKKLKVSIN